MSTYQTTPSNPSSHFDEVCAPLPSSEHRNITFRETRGAGRLRASIPEFILCKIKKLIGVL